MALRRNTSAAERAIAELLASQRSLYIRREAAAPIWLLCVHLDDLFLSRDFADCRFAVRLRYGGNGVYQEKYSQDVRCSIMGCQVEIQQGTVVQLHGLVSSAEQNGAVGVCERWDPHRCRWNVRLGSGEVKSVELQNLCSMGQAVASLGAMMIFCWDSDLPPRLSLEILKLGVFDKVISQATVAIPFREDVPGVAEQDLVLVRKLSSGCCLFPQAPEEEPAVLGTLRIAVELRRFALQELEEATLESDIISMLSLFALAHAAAANRAATSPVAARAAATATMGTPVAGASSGNTPLVIGRPVPGSGWSWAGMNVDPQRDHLG